MATVSPRQCGSRCGDLDPGVVLRLIEETGRSAAGVADLLNMCVMNDLDRYHLATDVVDRIPTPGPAAAYTKQDLREKLVVYGEYIAEVRLRYPWREKGVDLVHGYGVYSDAPVSDENGWIGRRSTRRMCVSEVS